LATFAGESPATTQAYASRSAGYDCVTVVKYILFMWVAAALPGSLRQNKEYMSAGCPGQFLNAARKYKTSHDLVKSWDVCRTALPRSLLDFKI